MSQSSGCSFNWYHQVIEDLQMEWVIQVHDEYKSTQMIGLSDLGRCKTIINESMASRIIDLSQLSHLISSHYSPVQEHLLNHHHLDLFNRFIEDDILDTLLVSVSTSSAILSLTYVMKSNHSSQIKSKCSSLLSSLLLRPDGVSSLLSIMLNSPHDLNSSKNIQLAKLLSTKPSSLDIDAYLQTIIPNILNTLLLSPPTNHLKVISLSLDYFKNKYTNKLDYHLHYQLITPFHAPNQSLILTNALTFLSTLIPHSTLVLNCYANKLFPILFNLGTFLDSSKTADPLYKSLLDDIFTKWAFSIDKNLAIEAIWNTLTYGNGWNDDSLQWHASYSDGLLITRKSLSPSTNPNLFDIQQSQSEKSLSIDPDPEVLATFVTNTNRSDILSPILSKCLSQYQGLKDLDQLESMDLKIILRYLHFSTCLVEQMGQQVLDNKDDILNFIYHSLHAQQQRKTASTLHQTSVENTSQHSKDLLIFEDHVEDSLKDSVDDSDTLEVDQILISTALSLLLATLEADSSINTENTPILTLIAGRLDIFVCDFPAISPVAHECQLVLSARNATSSLKDEETSSPYLAQRKVYAQALRDIQDSQLPVRAHGLDSLRKLVDQTVPKNRFDASEYNTLDPQLVKDILDVFIQAIKADDSYIYLNAVRGLVVMTDKIGHEILSQLSVRYAKHDQQIAEIDLDQRLRIGEAIIQVIRNLSDTLPAYTHLIIPQLIKVMSDNSMPTLLRASTLTILSQASTTCIRAIEPYMGEIVSGVEDILIIESLHESKDIDHPLDTQTNLVQLKRSALVLVAMVFRSAYETGNGGISASTKNNLVTKIRYIAQVDNDDLVRHQANEILDEFDWSNRLP